MLPAACKEKRTTNVPTQGLRIEDEVDRGRGLFHKRRLRVDEEAVVGLGRQDGQFLEAVTDADLHFMWVGFSCLSPRGLKHNNTNFQDLQHQKP